MKIENVKIDKVTAKWGNRRHDQPKGHAKVVLVLDTDDMTALAFLDSLYGETVTVDFGVPADEGAGAAPAQGQLGGP